MTAPRLAAAALLALVALVAVLVWRQESRIASLEERVAPSPVPAPAAARPQIGRVGTEMRLRPEAADALARALAPSLGLDAAATARLAPFLRVHIAKVARERLRAAGGSTALDADSAALAERDLDAELDHVGLEPEQRARLVALLPTLIKPAASPSSPR
jgi:hypothetical protein